MFNFMTRTRTVNTSAVLTVAIEVIECVECKSLISSQGQPASIIHSSAPTHHSAHLSTCVYYYKLFV